MKGRYTVFIVNERQSDSSHLSTTYLQISQTEQSLIILYDIPLLLNTTYNYTSDEKANVSTC